MANIIRISDEQLAYLNSNIDLVNKYINDRRLEYENDRRLANLCQFKPVNYIAVVRNHWDSYISMQPNFSSDDLNYSCDWRVLLQFVEDHDSAPANLQIKKP